MSGSCLLYSLNILTVLSYMSIISPKRNAWDVVVIVSRWYGGIKVCTILAFCFELHLLKLKFMISKWHASVLSSPPLFDNSWVEIGSGTSVMRQDVYWKSTDLINVEKKRRNSNLYSFKQVEVRMKQL